MCSALGSDLASGRLRRQCGLVRDLVEDDRLDNLCFRKWCGHFEQRLVREYDVTFGNGPHIAGESQRCEVVEGTTIETVSGEPCEILVVEGEVLEYSQHVFEPSGDNKSSIGRQFADEQAERRRLGHPPRQVAGRHRQLVAIGGQRNTHRDMVRA